MASLREIAPFRGTESHPDEESAQDVTRGFGLVVHVPLGSLPDNYKPTTFEELVSMVSIMTFVRSLNRRTAE